MNELQQQMQFLIEIDKLKAVERQTRIIHGDRREAFLASRYDGFDLARSRESECGSA
ncbi:hypothetical protein ACFTRD_15205 [Paenibacillus sp. NPDC056933]|uniref:hypothetical protein n=1 Tax=Paenibacillus sp. NPDC056933 TaxID=3345968 RepID=UPI0036304977